MFPGLKSRDYDFVKRTELFTDCTILTDRCLPEGRRSRQSLHIAIHVHVGRYSSSDIYFSYTWPPTCTHRAKDEEAERGIESNNCHTHLCQSYLSETPITIYCRYILKSRENQVLTESSWMRR